MVFVWKYSESCLSAAVRAHSLLLRLWLRLWLDDQWQKGLWEGEFRICFFEHGTAFIYLSLNFALLALAGTALVLSAGTGTDVFSSAPSFLSLCTL
jgi:hypothetical protein